MSQTAYQNTPIKGHVHDLYILKKHSLLVFFIIKNTDKA